MSASELESRTQFAGALDVDSSCLQRIRQHLPALDGTRRQIAEYVIANTWKALGLSISDLAAQCGVSENAVSRFTRSIGYPGYRAFSQALSMDLGRNLGVAHSHPVDVVHQATDARDSLIKLIARVFELEISCIQDTLANLGEPQLQRAITALVESRRVLLVGTGAAAPLCQMAQYRFSNLGLQAAWTADPMVMVSEVSQLGLEDVVLGVSYSGQSQVTIEVLDYARTQRGATTICLTATQGSRIIEFADIALVVFGSNVPIGNAQFSARVSGMVLLEAIATAVAVKKYGETVPNLNELSEMQARINAVGSNWKPARLRGR